MAARAVATVAASAVVLAVLLAGGASAQSSPSPSSQCTTVLVSLSPCLNYISGNESTAPATCCAQLGKVVQSDPQCLCVALSADPASLGLTVNRTRALGLPDVCKVKTPDVSNCKGGAAAGAPVTSPGTTTPAGQTTPATGATGSKTTPTTTSVPEAAAASPRGSAGVVAGFIVAALVVAGFAV
ncbi:non-specific lipid transfer protein GPI-anchored 5-like [Miscanthus floridulus]|uniref:non-specific lipid transfer protein GPI-anchored 5-like n=1 Tax=Miscanthus floridulus TaxID=154761 RepID=UPI0034577F3D